MSQNAIQEQAVTSADGTRIAVSTIGSGPAVVLVDGALCHRNMGPLGDLATALADRFTVYTYDRRGRGASGDAGTYAVEREVEDLAAVIAAAGGSADVYGISSGGALALEAAAAGVGVRKLALYEVPYVSGPAENLPLMDELVAAGKRADAVRLFLRTVGVPAVFVSLMRFMPAWSQMKDAAHTLPYDFRVVGAPGSIAPLPRDRWSVATMPILALDGGRSHQRMRDAMREVVAAVPSAQYRTLPGQTHMLKTSAIAPVLTEFFQP